MYEPVTIQRPRNLNQAEIYVDESGHVPPSFRKQRQESQKDGAVEVFFDNLEERLASEIEKYPAVVGCMAWLTNPRILAALSTRKEVSIIVQKEDFLRPDSGDWTAAKLHRLYAALPESNRLSLGSLFYNYSSDPMMEAVRCVGFRRATNDAQIPRMHHKFIVFLESGLVDGDPAMEFVNEPVSVWTGSFNATKNAVQSLENAVLIRSVPIARAFRAEWERLLGISEPLDWHHEYIAPEYRIGS